ncbi:hypothetical protein RJ640_000044 [Escallonia rubra]|uniref:FAD-binding domain-containing protein n=1 Tax=Escallonia rubra TaxID=112253 RepID=A0AA88RT12_9ASTE|nr:hypothetical protein RJ640_000044 [Escallonia rubra]
MDAREVNSHHEIVIVGGGICGLATALALHRKGITSVVLERSESLRASGAAIGIRPNGWRALDQLGVGSVLRQTALPIHGFHFYGYCVVQEKDLAISWLTATLPGLLKRPGENRCLKRSDLINTLANALPPQTIHFSCQVASVKLNLQTTYPTIHLQDGSTIEAKVLIGCDGANSVIADFLELKPTKLFSLLSVRGLTNYPDGHTFGQEFVRMMKKNTLTGRIAIDDKLVYWFVSRHSTLTGGEVSNNPELIRQSTLQFLKDFPTEITEMIDTSDPESLSLTHLRYRAPWDLLFGRFRKGTVTVAGDAMHVMGPFLGQGGSAGLEDAVVLARSLAQKMADLDSVNCGRTEMVSRIGEAIDQYVKERRMRVVQLSAQTYLIGLHERQREMDATSEVNSHHEIVIVGGGICGLATALALHRKGIASVILERSESLRASGAGIGIRPNGWRALDQLGVGSILRQTALPIHLYATDSICRAKRPENSFPRKDLPQFSGYEAYVCSIKMIGRCCSRENRGRRRRRSCLVREVLDSEMGSEILAVHIIVDVPAPLVLVVFLQYLLAQSEINGVNGSESNPTSTTDPHSTRVFFDNKSHFVDPDPGHSFQAIRAKIFGSNDTSLNPAPMNGFAQQAESMEPDMPQRVMNGFDPSMIPVYKTLVSEFAVFDRWFASVPSSTQPNRLYVHSATSHGATSNIPSLLVMENRRRRLAAAEAFASSPSSDHHNQQTHEDAPPPRVMGSWVSSHGCRENVRARGLVRLPGENRFLKRSDLINTLANALPPHTIHFGCKVVSVKLNLQPAYPVIHLQDGSTIVAKVLIGCDGANSVVADFLELKPTKLFTLLAVRGLTNYPDGHKLAPEFLEMMNNNTSIGRVPIDEKSVYWYVAQKLTPTGAWHTEDAAAIYSASFDDTCC